MVLYMDYCALSWVLALTFGQLTVSSEALHLEVCCLSSRSVGITKPCDSFRPANCSTQAYHMGQHVSKIQ